ncbi:MAG: NAD(P)H-dependent oxidoreductase subunit E [Peptococcaceae bacterium]|nr:NAD(P)H-dependent oxidoreductase subunit E [Peptococcaceae bacterium]
MKVQVCIGSACHQRGSYDILMRLRELVVENGLEKDVSVGSAFCLNNCADGISVAVDDDIITGIGKGNVDQLFEQVIKARL